MWGFFSLIVLHVWSLFFLPLYLGLGLLFCDFCLLAGMGLSPRWFLHALHSLWLLKCSPLQLTQLCFSSCGRLSVLWFFNPHRRHLGCLQLAVWCEYIPHLLHWDTWGLSLYGLIVQL